MENISQEIFSGGKGDSEGSPFKDNLGDLFPNAEWSLQEERPDEEQELDRNGTPGNGEIDWDELRKRLASDPDSVDWKSILAEKKKRLQTEPVYRTRLPRVMSKKYDLTRNSRM